MVLNGVVWTLFTALQAWLILVSMYAWQVDKYKRLVTVFWVCQAAIVAAQVFIVSANYVTPIPWFIIYMVTAGAYFRLHHVDGEDSSFWLAITMLASAVFCLAYIYLSGRHDRYGSLNYVFTIGLNMFAVPQGVLLYGGAKRIIIRNGE